MKNRKRLSLQTLLSMAKRYRKEHETARPKRFVGQGAGSWAIGLVSTLRRRGND